MSDLYLSQGQPVPRPWGGKRFSPAPGQAGPIGEVWEVSTHPDGLSSINGRPLSEVCGNLPFLIKWLDTAQALSVQVHPSDAYSLQHEGQRGKNECWLVLEAAPEAHLYLGLAPGVTKQQLMQACAANQEVPSMLQKYNVKAGDFFYVPAGSVHAIGAGITLLEVQQSSGVTYRLWDWGRTDAQGRPRELHLAKGQQVLNETAAANRAENFLIQSLNHLQSPKTVVETSDFRLHLAKLNAGETITMRPARGQVGSLLCLKGSCQVELNQQQVSLKSLQSALAKGAGGVQVLAKEAAWVAWVD